MMKNALYFTLKPLFVLKIFKFLSWLFKSCSKNGSIRKTRLISKLWRQNLVKRQLQYTLPNISWSKGNQTMTYGQLIGYKKRNVFLQKSCKKWGRETSPRLLFVFKKSFIWGKSKFQYISIVHNLACNIIKRCRTWDYWSRDMLNFDFLQKGLGIVSPPYFM